MNQEKVEIFIEQANEIFADLLPYFIGQELYLERTAPYGSAILFCRTMQFRIRELVKYQAEELEKINV